MMIDVNKIKDEYAHFLCQNDWLAFKTMAEYYLLTAAKLRKQDITAHSLMRLWIRNSTKRLFLGIGCELLLKSFYLKEGYCINKPKQNGITAVPTHKLATIDPNNFDHRETYTFGALIDNLRKISSFQNQERILNGFKIAMVFRNKEGHTTSISHKFDPQDYIDIETGVISFYHEAFNLKLNFHVSMKSKERGIFEIDSSE